jgi:CxxC motif-containing protein (DUF1111 family)
MLTACAFAGIIASLTLLMGAPGGIPGPPPKAPKIRLNHPPPPGPTPTPSLSGFGALLPGVTLSEKAAWLAGRAQFQTPETVADGLGPIFNNTNCFACHQQPDVGGAPVVGGASAQTEVRFKTNAGIFDLVHVSSINPSVCQDQVPFDAILTAHRKSNQTFGLGLIENIPDATILANQNRNLGRDGVFGRAAILTDPVTTRIAGGHFFDAPDGQVVGRFGWKAQAATLLGFDAQINELGETTRFFPTDLSPHQGGLEPPNDAARNAAEPPGLLATDLQDTPANPSLPEGPSNFDDLDRYVFFMALNSPPPTVPLTVSALNGRALFTKINCVACHLPNMTTGGGSKISAVLNFVNVPLYSDLLLHDTGPALGDGIQQGAASANEFRSAPLWGVRARAPYLHDGRAPDLMTAILAHAGEAQKIRDRFANLPAADQQDILNFLNSI